MQGFFGKIPSLGDFVTRDLPRGFLDTWDEWLQKSIAESKASLGDVWLDTYLTSPIWRFVLLPGVCGKGGWAGILMPSVDRVGRYFPLTFATSLGEGVQPFQVIEGATDWFNSAEALALTVLDEDNVDADALGSSLRALDDTAMQANAGDVPILEGGAWGLCLSDVASASISAAVCHELVRFQVGAYSVWWTSGTDDLVSMGLVAPELPDPLCFAQLLTGAWDESAETTRSEEEVAAAELAEEPF